jgi:hypothetical protein
MLQAMNTGHDGSLTTVHANSPRDTLSRLETLVLMAGFDLPAPDEATAARIAALTGEAAVANPLDLTLAGLKPEVLGGSIAALLESESYDALAVVVGSSALAQPRLAAAVGVDCAGWSVR